MLDIESNEDFCRNKYDKTPQEIIQILLNKTENLPNKIPPKLPFVEQPSETGNSSLNSDDEMDEENNNMMDDVMKTPSVGRKKSNRKRSRSEFEESTSNSTSSNYSDDTSDKIDEKDEKRRKVNSASIITLASALKHKGDNENPNNARGKYRYYFHSGIHFIKGALAKLEEKQKFLSYSLFKQTGQFFYMSAKSCEKVNEIEISELMYLGAAICYLQAFKMNMSNTSELGRDITMHFKSIERRNSEVQVQQQIKKEKKKKVEFSPIDSPSSGNSSSSSTNSPENIANNVDISKEYVQKTIQFVEQGNYMILVYKSLGRAIPGSPLHKNMFSCTVQEVNDFLELQSREIFKKYDE